jgi:hypothetical protein
MRRYSPNLVAGIIWKSWPGSRGIDGRNGVESLAGIIWNIHNYGYFALLSNEIKNSVEALEIYRNKDQVEKAFDNLKERLNLRRMAVTSEQSLDGKLFIQFVALIFLSSITKKMQDNNLFKDYTMRDILDEFDLIECVEVPGQQLHVGETTKRQVDLYTKLGAKPSASL